jgi:hypothetical protein
MLYMNSLNDIKAGINASYKKNDEAKQILAEQGFSLDDQLSGQRAKVFLNPEGKPVVAFRGTKNKHDMVTDALIMAGLGKYTKRVKHSKKVMKEVEAKYNKPATAIGHSLGSYLAENSGNHGKIITYNKLALPYTQPNNKNQVDIRTSNDLASIMTRPRKGNITLKSKSWNPFTSHSTKSLKDKNVIKGKFI